MTKESKYYKMKNKYYSNSRKDLDYHINNKKIEKRLKSIVEYQDTYLPEMQKILITERIRHGGYKHILNCLKIAKAMEKIGIMELYNVDKKSLLLIIILHDIGKVQPLLKIGDVVDPKIAFEKGEQHAYRSAQIAINQFKDIGVTKDIYNIIKYHHHSEKDLPKNFPKRLLIMHRIFRIIDGISAAITRRQAMVEFKLIDSILYIKEHNHHPEYRQLYSIDLYSKDNKKTIYDYNSNINNIISKNHYR